MSTKTKPRILFWDIETSYMLLAGFGLYDQNFSHKNIIQDWYIICASWMFEGDKKVSHITCKGQDDSRVVEKLLEVLSKADIIVHHNGDKFDLKKLRARAIFHRFPTMANIATVDTLKVARKLFAFSSNRLGHIAEFLNVAKKGKPPEGTWLDVMKGDKKALKEMVLYCDQDVLVLRDVYMELLPYITNHPSVAALLGKEKHEACNNCGSSHLKKRGKRVQRTKIVQTYQCGDCGSWKSI